MKYYSKEGETVDGICWNYYGKTAGVVETVLATNRGLASYGAVLPAGVVIELPEISSSSTDKTVQRLWE